ncbi:hypothetical protein AMTR_s00070p00056180 [Amborella trichopoda]|uniref:Uncharacterized protein n=1 Tax=Amborella trichopoda TaxID=13333 RepID=U5D4R5_AMBTC|nr:hypothetical protein AMTR_s00070p00056180 [Amborella trichopoda]
MPLKITKILEYELDSLTQVTQSLPQAPSEPPNWRGVFQGLLEHGTVNLRQDYSANQELDCGLLEAQYVDLDPFEAQQLEQQQEPVDLQVVNGGTSGVVEGGEVLEVGWGSGGYLNEGYAGIS